MKRWSHTVFALLAVLTGCQRETLPEGEPMVFSVASPAVTKAVAAEQPDTEGYLIAPSNQVKLYATWSLSGQEDQQVLARQALICQDNLSWDYTPVKYWRKYGTYSFAAVYPYSADCLSGTSGKGLMVRYALGDEPVDLLVARAQRNASSADYSAVELPFRHACAAVRFLFKKASASYAYHLQSFCLQNLYVSGQLDTSGGDPTLDSWYTSTPDTEVIPWEAASAGQRKEIPLTYEDYVPEARWYYMIPQSMTPKEGYAHPAVTFSVVFNNEPTPVTTTLELPDSYVEGGIPVQASWEPGKVYNYYINLQPSRVSITVHVTDWEEKTLVVNDVTFD